MLKETVAMLERQSGKLLKRIRCDNRTEFTKDLVNIFCQCNGVILETMVPYTPEQNGIAERAISIYFEMVRCMLHLAKMDLCYWGEAFLYAIHIQSCTHIKALKEIVPSEVWFGRKLDISHCFGTLEKTVV